MEPLIERRQRYNHCRVAPGAVGSVGDVLGSVRLKHSAPDLPIRWEKEFHGQKEKKLGANISDGDHEGYTSGGLGARVMDSNWQSGRGFRTADGWKIQDYRAADKLVEPYVGSTFDFSWRNRVATTYELKRPGDLFLHMPGGYAPHQGETSRGASVRITAVEPGDLVPEQTVRMSGSDPSDLMRRERRK